jgi:hypothetical protein
MSGSTIVDFWLSIFLSGALAALIAAAITAARSQNDTRTRASEGDPIRLKPQTNRRGHRDTLRSNVLPSYRSIGPEIHLYVFDLLTLHGKDAGHAECVRHHR